MAPDFPYFILLSDITRFGHTIPGLFFFCVPAGLAFLFVFHRFLRQPLLSISPHSLRCRVPANEHFAFGPPSRFFSLAVAILIGAVTHLLWDGFTHRGTIFVNHIALLRTITPIMNQPVYELLQHASSVVGLLLLCVAYMRWIKRTPLCADQTVAPLSRNARWTLITAAILTSLIFGLCFGYYRTPVHSSGWFSAFVVRTVIGSVTAGSLCGLAFSLWWHRQNRLVPESEEALKVNV